MYYEFILAEQRLGKYEQSKSENFMPQLTNKGLRPSSHAYHFLCVNAVPYVTDKLV